METWFNKVVLFLSFLGIVTAHVGLTFPPARKLDLDFLDNIRTNKPCGMPRGQIRTQLAAGSSVNITWHLAYPHVGGFRLELLDKDENLMLNLTDPTTKTSYHVTGDPTAQWYTVMLPAALTCNDCTIRLLREAKEWSNNYGFWSCADVSIVKAKDYKEDCFGRGKPNSDSGCTCDKGYWGLRCQYKDECADDSDCSNGKCIDLGGTSLPRKQCFCSPGFHGEGCKLENKDTLPTPENLQLSSHTKTMLSDRMELYHKIVSSASVPDDEKEMEFVLVINGTSYAAIGLRPSTIDKTCKSMPAVGVSNVRTKRAAKSRPQKSNPTLLEPLQLPEKIRAEPEPSMNNKRSAKDKKGFGDDKLVLYEKQKAATAEPSTPESESAPEIVATPETEPEPKPEAEPEPETGKAHAEPTPIKEPVAEPEKSHAEPTPGAEISAEPKPEGEIAAEPEPENSKLQSEPLPRKEPTAEPEKPHSEPAPTPENIAEPTPEGEIAAEPEPEKSKAEPEPNPTNEPTAEPEKTPSKPVPSPETEPTPEGEIPAESQQKNSIAEPEPNPTHEPAAEPEKVSAEPEPERGLAEPEPEKGSAEPEPEKALPEPEPEKVSAEPEPEKVSAEPEPEKVSAEPEPEKGSAEPEPEKGLAEPEPEKSVASGEPEAAANEPAAEVEPQPESEPEPKGKSLLDTSPYKLEKIKSPYTPKGDFHAMDCTDIVIGTARGMLSRVRDYYTRDRSTPRLDTFWGGTEDITSATGWEMNGITTIIFRRKLKAMDPTDHSIAGTMHLIWARGQEHGEYVHLPKSGLEREKPSVPNFYAQDEIKYHGQSKQRGVRFIDFSERL
ncbi:unnamed protein product [Orchesella dallaii]|uniref:Cell surface glycoprotein 1 n=1 Tax=Orchesella dallaii TaxID=48710 RepID=A0ABP1S326_9HEXA